MSFRISQIDHVELFVPDRFQAARWYQDILGLEIVPEFRFWAEDPNGPLMIATPDGQTRIALFQGESHGSVRGTGYHLLAFRTDAEAFLSILQELDSMNLFDRNDAQVTRHSVRDHGKAFSIYFCDPWRNELEITSYDHQAIRARLTN